MHLRRALLLFAVVLAASALVASLFQPTEQPARPQPPTSGSAPGPTAQRAPAERAASFDARRTPVTRRLRQGASVRLTVRVERAGLVALRGLDLEDAAEPLTPATFDVLLDTPGRYAVWFIPSAGGRPRKIGMVVVEPARRHAALPTPVRAS
jgi:hypothetical protein